MAAGLPDSRSMQTPSIPSPSCTRTSLPLHAYDAPRDLIADGNVLHKLIGRRRFKLLHAQLQALGFRIRRDDDRTNDLPDLHDFAGILDSLFACEF